MCVRSNHDMSARVRITVQNDENVRAPIRYQRLRVVVARYSGAEYTACLIFLRSLHVSGPPRGPQMFHVGLAPSVTTWARGSQPRQNSSRQRPNLPTAPRV